jgi:hypothetical protein
MGSGNYQIKAYRYRDPDGTPNNGDEIGTLLVEGKQESAVSQSAVSQVQVTMPIVQKALAGSFAGLYASNIINLGNNDVKKVDGETGSAANIICRDCTVPSGCSGGTPTQESLNSAVNKGPNSQIDGKIFIGDPQVPPVPAAPATACSATTLISGEQCSITLPSNELTNGAKLTFPTLKPKSL